jgi:prepilin-type N-terminal cleavage/methylation domain-containing protein
MKRQGFTLIELLVVIAIITILSVCIFVGIQGEKEKQKVHKDIAQENELDQTAMAFKPENIEPTTDQTCGGISDIDARRQCEDYRYKQEMIQKCIERYQD